MSGSDLPAKPAEVVAGQKLVTISTALNAVAAGLDVSGGLWSMSRATFMRDLRTRLEEGAK